MIGGVDMEEMTILGCAIVNSLLALVALEIDKSNPARIHYSYSWWRLAYVCWILGSVISIPILFVYIHRLGGF